MDMNDEEKASMGQHVNYWKKLMDDNSVFGSGSGGVVAVASKVQDYSYQTIQHLP